MFPQINYIVNEKGFPIFVQMPVRELLRGWRTFT